MQMSRTKMMHIFRIKDGWLVLIDAKKNSKY